MKPELRAWFEDLQGTGGRERGLSIVLSHCSEQDTVRRGKNQLLAYAKLGYVGDFGNLGFETELPASELRR